MGRFLKVSCFIFAMLFCGLAQAEDISIGESLKKIPALKQGVAWSVIDSKLNYLATFDVFTWKAVSLEAGYAGVAENTGDKAVAVLSYNVANLKEMGVKTPILDLIDLRVGIYAGIGRIEAGTGPVMRGNNEFDAGISLTAISIKF